MWPSLLKIQYTVLQLLCGNDPVVKNFIYSNGDLDLWSNDPKINRVLPLPQGRQLSFLHDNFVLYIGSLPNLTTWFPCGRGRTLFMLGSKVKVTCYKCNFWQQDRFCTITLVLYIGPLTNLATWFPCGRGRTLFILGSLDQRSRSPLL
jgi:hypothetical protein